MEVFTLCDFENITRSHTAHCKQKQITVAIVQCELTLTLLVSGNWAKIAYRKASGVSVSVSETTAGRSDGSTATLRLAGVDSPPIDNSMSAETVRVPSHRVKANTITFKV